MDDVSDIRKSRLVENEAMFRRQNYHAKNALRHILPAKEPIKFVCECSTESCHERISLTATEYTALHEKSNYYIIKPGHETAQVERIVSKTPTYYLVEKYDIT